MTKLGLVLISISLMAGLLAWGSLSPKAPQEQEATPSTLGHYDLNILQMAYQHHLANRCNEAISWYSEYLRLYPNQSLVYVNRADAYFRLGKYKLAFADADKAIKLDPNESFAYCNRGEAALYLGKAQAAISDLDRAISLNPKFGGEPYYYRSKACLKLGRKDQAAKDLKESQRLEFDPQKITAYYQVAPVK